MIVAELRPCSSETIPQTFRKHFRSSSFESRKRPESYHGPVMRTCRLPCRTEGSMLFLTANSGHFPTGNVLVTKTDTKDGQGGWKFNRVPGKKTRGSPWIIWIILIFLHNAISFQCFCCNFRIRPFPAFSTRANRQAFFSFSTSWFVKRFQL